ncbi:MAG: peptidase A26, partial [Candidatus Hydrogenedentes bacterium]|nr:peptidase A26 [Candidatus Hydrogenedentota bacterium]
MFLNRIVFAAIPSNRFVALIVFLILIAGTFASALAAPIQIGTIEDLQKIGNDSAYPPSGSYVLTQDIDASATATWNNGIGFAPIGNDSTPFTGTFDGQGHVISGLTINRLGEAGLFGMMDGQVKNVGLQGGSVTGSEYVGGLVGENRGTVTQCYATGAVSGRYVGGLVGENGGTVTQCYATGTVTGSGDAVGGLVGNNHIGTVTQCYATGTVTGSVDVGGLVGRSTNAGAQLTACYATGAVSGSDDVGGLVGHNDDIVRQCYATGAVSGSDDVGGLVGRNG